MSHKNTLHPFTDKLFVFTGNPTRCSRQAAREALTAVGGVIEERITTFTHYIVAFAGAEKTKVYQKAVEHDKYGHMVLLDESQFFDALEGKVAPLEKKEYKAEGVYILHPPNAPTAENKNAAIEKYVMERKRLKNMLRSKDSTPDVDVRKTAVAVIGAVLQMQNDTPNEEDDLPDGWGQSEICAACSQASSVTIAVRGTAFVSLCQDCHNEFVAQTLGMDSPEDIPKKLSFTGKGGKTYNFAIDFEIFPAGKLLTATEIGKTKRMTDVFGALDADAYEMLETLKKRIKKLVSVKYIDDDGYFAKNKAVGYVEYNLERERHEIIIDGKPYSWSEIEKNISAHEGWKIKIEFADHGDELD